MNKKEATNQIQSISLTIQSFAVGLILVFPALLNINLFSTHIELYFLPIAAIYFWPKRASYSWSLFAVFLLGLIFDVFFNGPLGMWALIYVVLFLVLDGGAQPIKGFVNSTVGFVLSLTLVSVLVIILTRLSIGQWPNLFGIFMNALIALLVFPIIFWVRKFVLAVRGISENDSIRP